MPCLDAALPPGPAGGPDGEAWTTSWRGGRAARRFVLKRAWDYGGKAVFLGRSVGTGLQRAREGALRGAPDLGRAVRARGARTPAGGGYVVQEVVETQPEDHFVCTGDRRAPTSFYVDYSAYASVGLAKQPAWGGVCRGSRSESSTSWAEAACCRSSPRKSRRSCCQPGRPSEPPRGAAACHRPGHMRMPGTSGRGGPRKDEGTWPGNQWVAQTVAPASEVDSGPECRSLGARSCRACTAGCSPACRSPAWWRCTP